MTDEFEKCEIVNDGMYCNTHKCGAPDNERCGKPDCPHCWVDHKLTPLNEVNATLQNMIRKGIPPELYGGPITHVADYDPEAEGLKREATLLFSFAAPAVVYVQYGRAGSAT